MEIFEGWGKFKHHLRKKAVPIKLCPQTYSSGFRAFIERSQLLAIIAAVAVCWLLIQL